MKRKKDKTYKVEQLLAFACETFGSIGHESLALSCTNYRRTDDEFKVYEYPEGKNPLPLLQRFVFPLLQNIHSRHSFHNIFSVQLVGGTLYAPGIYSGIT